MLSKDAWYVRGYFQFCNKAFVKTTVLLTQGVAKPGEWLDWPLTVSLKYRITLTQIWETRM